VAEIIGEEMPKFLAARKSQGSSIRHHGPRRHHRHLPHSDWLNHENQVNAQHASCALLYIHGIMYLVLFVVGKGMIVRSACTFVSLRSCCLRQLPGPSRAEDGHDTEAAIEQDHGIRNQSSHRGHAT
jgi:hypothetical protein